MAGNRTGCDCCGTCCRKGGPALHLEDSHLIASGCLSLDDLITIRRGEYVQNPLAEEPRPSEHEFVKIRGKGATWHCIFLDEAESRCTMYESRPLACRLLQCRAPEDLLAITGKNLLTRFTIVAKDSPIYKLIQAHDAACPVTVMNSLTVELQSPETRNEAITELTRLVSLDYRLRSTAVGQHRLSLARELFYFGRPLFQLLLPLGIRFTAAPDGETLQVDIA